MHDVLFLSLFYDSTALYICFLLCVRGATRLLYYSTVPGTRQRGTNREHTTHNSLSTLSLTRGLHSSHRGCQEHRRHTRCSVYSIITEHKNAPHPRAAARKCAIRVRATVITHRTATRTFGFSALSPSTRTVLLDKNAGGRCHANESMPNRS